MVLDFIKDNISSFINLGWVIIVRKSKIVVNNYRRNDIENNNFSKILLPNLQKNKDDGKNTFSLCFSSANKTTALKDFISLLKKNDILYIVGNAGYGKSTLTEYIYKQLFKKKLFNIYPFYVQIKKLDQRAFINNDSNSMATPILDYIYDKDVGDRDVNVFGFHQNYRVVDWETFLRQFSGYKKIYLFIDGYDETAFINNGFKVIDEEIKEIIRNSNRKIKLIISSRYRPNLLAESRASTLYVSELKESQKQEFIKSENMNNNQHLYGLLNSPLLLTMYATTSEVLNNHDVDYITDIQTQADVYWNYYCYYLGRFSNGLNNLEYQESAIVFFKYVLPFIAYNLEFNNQVSFTKIMINECFELFESNYECFKKNLHFNIDYECVNEFINGEHFDEFIADIDLIEFDGVEYWFGHLTQRDFYAALFEYYKDYCILNTDYSKEDSIQYHPYKGLDDKVTIHNYKRVLYSNIIARRIINHMPVDYPNPAKYYCIKSDLHYYGDSTLIQKNIKAALDESIAGYMCCKKTENVDELSKNWLAWNIGFIVFDQLHVSKKEIYDDKDIFNVQTAISALKESQETEFGPAFDKFAKIYTAKIREGVTLYDIFVRYGLLNENDRLMNLQTKEEKAKEYLEKAVEKGYHFACNNLGYLYEQEKNVNNAYKYFSMSVENDQLDLYARARCAVYLLYNSNDIQLYRQVGGEFLAYQEAYKYLNDGYKYYYNNKGPKPYEIKGIYNLVKNLAEFGLLCHQKGYLELLNYNLGDSYEYYQSLFSLYILEYHDKKSDLNPSMFESKMIMEDLLCYCLVCMIIKKEGMRRDVDFSALNTSFGELCQKVYNYFNNQKYEQHQIFHTERFNHYYSLFCEKYNEVKE